MRITKKQLLQIIKEELTMVLRESTDWQRGENQYSPSGKTEKMQKDLLNKLHPDPAGNGRDQFDDVVYAGIIKYATRMWGRATPQGQIRFADPRKELSDKGPFYYSVFRRARSTYDWAKMFRYDGRLIFGTKGKGTLASNVEKFKQLQAKGLLPENWEIITT